MKLTITPTQRGGYRIVKAFAVIEKSAKDGIPARRQKTWTVRTVAPEFVAKSCAVMFEAEAKRWEAKVMSEFARTRLFHEECEQARAEWNKTYPDKNESPTK